MGSRGHHATESAKNFPLTSVGGFDNFRRVVLTATVSQVGAREGSGGHVQTNVRPRR